MKIIGESKRNELGNELAFLWLLTDVNERMPQSAKDIIFSNISSIAITLGIPYMEFIGLLEAINRKAIVYTEFANWGDQVELSFHQEMERRNKKQTGDVTSRMD